MMTFIDNELPVAADGIGDFALSYQALNERYVDATRWLAPAAGDYSDVAFR